MIAYHILCHANFKQVARQIEALYSPEDVFLIDIDDGRPVNLKPLKPWISRPNVYLKRDANIGWGGAGTLRKTINGAFFLLDANAMWKYYVVLSGQCLPIKPNSVIRERLYQLDQSETNSIRCFEHPPVEPEILRVLNQNERGRVKLWGDRGHTTLFVLPNTIDPQTTMAARWRVEVVELGHQSNVFIRPCNELLMHRRESFFSRYTFCAGANWFNLHRSLLEYMKSDPFAYELYEVLSTTFIPDESYFQTYIFNSPFREKIDMDHTRFINRPEAHLAVRAFEASDWDSIYRSSALFARKFDTQTDSTIVNRVLDYCREGSAVQRQA